MAKFRVTITSADCSDPFHCTVDALDDPSPKGGFATVLQGLPNAWFDGRSRVVVEKVE